VLHDVLHTSVCFIWHHLPQYRVKDLPTDGRGTLYHTLTALPVNSFRQSVVAAILTALLIEVSSF
jgi:hypothetical protein